MVVYLRGPPVRLAGEIIVPVHGRGGFEPHACGLICLCSPFVLVQTGASYVLLQGIMAAILLFATAQKNCHADNRKSKERKIKRASWFSAGLCTLQNNTVLSIGDVT